MIQPQPPGFNNSVFEFSFSVNASEEAVWRWLNDTRTFTDTQYWPWKVEFYSPDLNTIPEGFHQGVLTNHHGPLTNFAGVLTKVVENKYRDLQYAYGSYALSFRWFRPYRLEFETESSGSTTTVTGTLSAYVKPNLTGLWLWSQKIFWGRFKRWSTRSILRKVA